MSQVRGALVFLLGGNQHPVMKGELEGALPLVRVK